VAIAVSPDFGARIFLSDERIVLRNRAVVVQAQDFAAERIESLRNLFLCRFAGGDVELAIGAETQATSGMKLRRRNVFDNCRSICQTVARLTIARDAITLAVAAIVSV